MMSTVVPGVRLVNRQPTVKKAKLAKAEALNGDGPGTELQAMIEEFGFKPTADCGCKSRIAMMNSAGADGCRAMRDEIKKWLKDAYLWS